VDAVTRSVSIPVRRRAGPELIAARVTIRRLKDAAVALPDDYPFR
jgi:hypothetical protein